MYTLRCLLVAIFSFAMVAARPAMMLSHGSHPPSHGCGMTMASHHASHGEHHCPSTDDGTCCDDCMCACLIGAGVSDPAVALVAFYTQIATVIDRPDEIVRPRHSLALRLPPPLGPPTLARS